MALRAMRPLVLVLLASSIASADEGMWLFTDFPSDAVKKAYGFGPDAKWLDRVRLGSLRLAGGCSASFVSSDGLVLTNHHCARQCLEDLSSKDRDLLAQGFYAKTKETEERCPKIEANQLIAITDVSQRVLDATRGSNGADYQAKLKAVTATLESECAQGDAKKRCDLVTLFNGARFHLYAYRRFQDVRLAFAPEFSSAAFGGDADNFNFPRYGLDFALLRVWEDGKPRPTPEALKLNPAGAKENELVFVSGNPGTTKRGRTVAQLEYERDVALPWSLLRNAELRGRLDVWAQGSSERARVANSRLRAVENSLKAQRGQQEALVAPGFLEGKRAAEAELRAKAPEGTRGAWDDIETALAVQRGLYRDYQLFEVGEAFDSELFALARLLVRNAEESKKPNTERLPDYTDAKRPALVQRISSAVPISKDLEKARLGWSLTRMRNLLGRYDPEVGAVLGKEAPEDLAARLIDETHLDDVKVRSDVLNGAMVADPLLVFASAVDKAARGYRKQMEDQVEAPIKKAHEQIAQARRALFGTSGYPDATFSLRLSYGQVKGWDHVEPFTTVGGLFSIAGKPPYAPTQAWLAAKSKLDPKLHFNLATTNDIIGGNSGSPLLDRNATVVGLMFDGNLPSLGGAFGYDGRDNRATAVSAEIIVAALKTVYGAERLSKELAR
jgi:hypothetical protein